MPEDNITLFRILDKEVLENLASFPAIIAELIDSAKDPYYFGLTLPFVPAPLNQVD